MESERLFYRKITEQDAPFLHQLMNAPKWHQHIGDRGIVSEDAARNYIKNKMSDDIKDKGFVNYVMMEKSTMNPIGTCSLHDRDGMDGWDIGYALLPAYEGKGYASEGAKTMIDLAFKVHHQPKISAITSVHNNASYSLLEKLGFTYQGIIQLPISSDDIKLYQLENTI
jgi:ribosomal-protein-alanine N-acetyltransferase